MMALHNWCISAMCECLIVVFFLLIPKSCQIIPSRLKIMMVGSS